MLGIVPCNRPTLYFIKFSFSEFIIICSSHSTHRPVPLQFILRLSEANQWIWQCLLKTRNYFYEILELDSILNHFNIQIFTMNIGNVSDGPLRSDSVVGPRAVWWIFHWEGFIAVHILIRRTMFTEQGKRARGFFPSYTRQLEETCYF
jgi:hypothetical protein